MPHTRPANAVAAAIGARVFNLPIMPEKVVRALLEKRESN
jgi:CO/xanthine dehydrogenase Mo-binding subunit